MNDTKHGGPAFPLVAQDWHHKGMTLRDYFAAKYMQSLFSKNSIGIQDIETIAMYSYKVADVMLKAREKNT